MVANAAVGVYVDLEQMSEDDLDRVIDVDLKGALVCAQLAIPALRVHGGSSIDASRPSRPSRRFAAASPMARRRPGWSPRPALAVEVGDMGSR